MSIRELATRHHEALKQAIAQGENQLAAYGKEMQAIEKQLEALKAEQHEWAEAIESEL